MLFNQRGRQEIEEAVKRNRGNIPVRLHDFTTSQAQLRDPVALGPQFLRALLEHHFDSMLPQPGFQFTAVKTSQGNGGQLHLKAPAMVQEAVDKDLAGIAQADSVWHFIKSARQHKPPKAANSRWCLTMFLQPR